MAALALGTGEIAELVSCTRERSVRAVMDLIAAIGERKRADEALHRLNLELESRVQHRTQELAAANTQLEETLDTLRRAQQELVRTEKLASLGSLVEDPYLQICAIDETAMSNCRMRALLLSGHIDEVLSASETTLTPAELQDPSRYTVAAVGLHALAQAWAGHVPEAREAVRQGRKVLARYHGAGDDAIWLHVATAWVADPAEANESLAQVEDYAAGSGLPYRRVLAALSGLALHARLGHASEVDRAFAVAEREVHGLPEPGLLELLLEGFRTAAQLLDEPSEALNPQEVVMLKLLAGGATRSQIAHETSYSVNTVKAYLRSAYRKLGVADREQAVAAAVALDIVDAASVAHREAEHG